MKLVSFSMINISSIEMIGTVLLEIVVQLFCIFENLFFFQYFRKKKNFLNLKKTTDHLNDARRSLWLLSKTFF